MSELLSSITGGGGGFVSKFASAVVIVSSGATGTYATLTPPAGQKVKLTALSSQSGTQTNLTTIAVGGVDVATAFVLIAPNGEPSLTNQLTIGYDKPNQEAIIGAIGEAIELKTNVATSSGTVYAYQFGE